MKQTLLNWYEAARESAAWPYVKAAGKSAVILGALALTFRAGMQFGVEHPEFTSKAPSAAQQIQEMAAILLGSGTLAATLETGGFVLSRVVDRIRSRNNPLTPER